MQARTESCCVFELLETLPVTVKTAEHIPGVRDLKVHLFCFKAAAAAAEMLRGGRNAARGGGGAARPKQAQPGEL